MLDYFDVILFLLINPLSARSGVYTTWKHVHALSESETWMKLKTY